MAISALQQTDVMGANYTLVESLSSVAIMQQAFRRRVQEDLQTVNHTLTSKPFLVKSIGIAATLILIYLVVSTAPIANAQENLSQYMPTQSDLNTIRLGWTISDLLIDEQSTPHPFIHKSFSLNAQWHTGYYPDQIKIDIAIHSFSSPDVVPKNHEEILTRTIQGQTITSKGALTIGDTSYYAVSYSSGARWQGVSLIFTKGKYYVLVGVVGSSEDGLYEGQTTASVPTLADTETLARIVEAKLPGGAATTEPGTSPTVATSDGGLLVPPSSSNVVTTVAVTGGIAIGAAALGWFLAPWAWDVGVWLLRGRSAIKWAGRLNRFGEWVNQPRQVRGMGQGGTVNREGDYAYVTGNRDNVTFVSSDDVAREVNQIKDEIESSNLSPGEKEALKMNLEQNKHDELAKKKILDAARGSHIGY